MNYYKHHLNDYDAATAHLSWDEDTAYSRLLRLYYRTEKPIPEDLGQACRLIRASSKSERAAVQTVLSEFFELFGDGWHQKRCDEEIEAANRLGNVSRENGNLGGRPKKPSSNPEETQQVSEPEPSGFLRARGSTTPLATTPLAKEETRAMRADFDIWYQAYPRKVAPPLALKAYLKARKKADAATLLAGIERYRKLKPDYADWAHPATWLNEERWLDQPDALPSNGHADPDAERKTRARAISKGMHIPSISDHEVRRMVAAGYLSAEQAVAAGYEP